MAKILSVNSAGRDFVVGDLHGCFDLLEQGLKHVKFDTTKDRLFSVGDLVDRGPKNLDCLKLLYEPWFHAVQGNHEDLMVGALHPSGNRNMGAWWEPNGGNWNTGFDPEEQFFLADLVNIAKNLPLLITVELPNDTRFHVVHAELYSPIPITDEDLANPLELSVILAEQSVDGPSVIWGRAVFYEFYGVDLNDDTLKRARKHNRSRLAHPTLSNVYSGHTVLRNPLKIGPFVNIDTGSFLTGRPRYEWAGVTLTEPLTNRFWKTNYTGTQETELIVL